jgi:hypothetical protein
MTGGIDIALMHACELAFFHLCWVSIGKSLSSSEHKLVTRGIEPSRESCCPYEGNYVKDLQCLGRDLSTTIIVDNSPHSYVFQPENAVPIGTFIDDMEDQELLEITPILMGVAQVDDVRDHLGHQIAQAHANALRGRIQQSVI